MIVCSAVIQKMTLSQLQVNNSFCSFVLCLLSPFGGWGDVGEASLDWAHKPHSERQSGHTATIDLLPSNTIIVQHSCR